MRATDSPLTPEQAAVFAAGLYAVAAIEGVSPGERAEIEALLVEHGCGALMADLGAQSFDLVEARRVLDTSWLRTLLVRAAARVVGADHRVTAAERRALVVLAEALGVEPQFEATEGA